MTKFLIKYFIKNNENINNPDVRQQFGVLAGATGICCNILLVIAKFIIGFITSSIAITADAFNNLSDAGSSVVTLVGFKLAGKPADLEHPFGHGRIEYISGLFVSVAIIIMGFELGKTSFEKIINPTQVDFSIIPLIVIILSILVKVWMFFFYRKVGNIINSEAVKATALDSISDVAATSTVALGLIIGYLFNLRIDGYIGICVAAFILYSGFKAVKDTLNPLLGEMPDKEFIEEIENTVLEHEEIVGIHDLIVHNYGPGRLMLSLHAEVPSTIDVLKAHDTIDIIEAELKQKFMCSAVIHMDPIVIDDEIANEIHQKVIGIVNSIDNGITIHDFRMTKGPLHTNLIFDVVVPFDFKLTDEELTELIKDEVKKIEQEETYYAVIQIDKAYY